MTENNNHQTSNCNTEKVKPSKQKRKDSAAAKHIKNKDLIRSTQQIICISFSSFTKQNKTNPLFIYLFIFSLFMILNGILANILHFQESNRKFNINRKSVHAAVPPTWRLFVHDIAWLKRWRHNDIYTVSKPFFFFKYFSSAARDYKWQHYSFLFVQKSCSCDEFSPVEQARNKVFFYIFFFLLVVLVKHFRLKMISNGRRLTSAQTL